jgi:hypothetical protein
MILDLNQPAVFNISVTNNGADSSFSFYTFFGGGMEPKEEIIIKKGETKNLNLLVYPRDDWNLRGLTTFDYFIQAKDSSEVQESLSVNLINLESVFEIGASDMNPESEVAQVYIQNKVNFNFENLNVKFKSAFFNLDKKINLAPNEKQSFTIELNKENYQDLAAGFYTLNADITIDDINTASQGKINFVEKDILKTTKEDYGLIINTQIITKTNEGNTIEKTQTILKKSIISRLFTRFSPEPTLAPEREGMSVYYTWDQTIKPGESQEILVRTNWLIPFLIIILIVGIVVLSKKLTRTHLNVRKKISFVRAKGGEFALKVTVVLDAKKYIERVKLIDRLPPLVKMYERFGGEGPARMDKERNKLEWDFEHLDAGEKRVVSYIVYSKVGILGRFALPPAIAIFEREGKIREVASNKAFFLSQTRNDDY